MIAQNPAHFFVRKGKTYAVRSARESAPLKKACYSMKMEWQASLVF